MLNDVIRKDLTVIFCGINPGLKADRDGHHFSNRSNRFWKVLHQAGFTPHEIHPLDDSTILDFGYGLTVAVDRATRRADELLKEEFGNAIAAFKKKMKKFQPKYIAFLGKPAYMAFSGKREVAWGPQEADFCGAKVWVLPNPSGLNFGFRLPDLVSYYRELYLAINQQH